MLIIFSTFNVTSVSYKWFPSVHVAGLPNLYSVIHRWIVYTKSRKQLHRKDLLYDTGCTCSVYVCITAFSNGRPLYPPSSVNKQKVLHSVFFHIHISIGEIQFKTLGVIIFDFNYF